MTTFPSHCLRFFLLFAPKLLEKVLTFWLHSLTSHWTFPQLIAQSTFCAITPPKPLLPRMVWPMFHSIYSTLLGTTRAWLLAALNTINWSQQFLTLASMGQPFLIIFSSVSRLLFPFSVSSPAQAQNMELLLGAALLALSPHTPERFDQHLCFSYQLTLPTPGKGPLISFVCSCFSIFYPVSATPLVTAPALPLRTFPCP